MVSHIISVSYGNDSIALLQWAHGLGLPNVATVYCDTGWSHSSWEKRVEDGEKLSRGYGFHPVRIRGDLTFPEMVRMKKGFPHHGAQFCTGLLKGLPFLDYCDKVDPEKKSFVVIGKRRAESFSRSNLPEYVYNSKYHGGRNLWHPLFNFTDHERNLLILKANFEILHHRSLECSPCVNANKKSLRMIDSERISQIRALEREVGHPMFRPKKKLGAVGIDEVLKWSVSKRGKYRFGPSIGSNNSHECQMELCWS